MRSLAFMLAWLLASTSALASAPNLRVIGEIRRASSLEAQTEKTTLALDILLWTGCFHAKRLGHDDVAAEVCGQWETTYRPMLMAAGEGIGDHEPLSQWLAAAAVILHEALGDDLFQLLRLTDLIVFNFGIPVMLEPHAEAAWCLELPNVPCREEYREHSERVISSSSYWIAWGSCVGATWGLGAIGFLCSPVGLLTEQVVLVTVAPRISNRIWDKRNPE